MKIMRKEDGSESWDETEMRWTEMKLNPKARKKTSKVFWCQVHVSGGSLTSGGESDEV